MTYYNPSDPDVPMNFYKFYIWVRVPLIVLSDISTLIKGETDSIALLISMVEMLTIIFACVGLYKKEYWGYLTNKIFTIAESIIGFIYIVFGIYEAAWGYPGFASSIGCGLGLIITNILICLYFEKRRYFFKGVPNKYNNSPIYTCDMDTRLIRILHLNGSVSERYEDISEFNFDYLKFCDESGTLYFREEIRNGQIVRVAKTKEQWMGYINQNPVSQPKKTANNEEPMPIHAVLHVLTKSLTVREDFVRLADLRCDYTKYLDKNGDLYCCEFENENGGTDFRLITKEDWDKIFNPPKETPQREVKPKRPKKQFNFSKLKDKMPIIIISVSIILAAFAVIMGVRSCSNPQSTYVKYSCDISEAKYIGNSNSGKFHRKSCKHLPDKSNQIGYKTYDDAIYAKMEPCKICKPKQ
ncbi:MAG: hypothetical protein J1G06_09015 [Oscillospiraceae bacterium]|nr:hypothetical protein [Oscillospiraceae bacterium]